MIVQHDATLVDDHGIQALLDSGAIDEAGEIVGPGGLGRDQHQAGIIWRTAAVSFTGKDVDFLAFSRRSWPDKITRVSQKLENAVWGQGMQAHVIVEVRMSILSISFFITLQQTIHPFLRGYWHVYRC